MLSTSATHCHCKLSGDAGWCRLERVIGRQARTLRHKTDPKKGKLWGQLKLIHMPLVPLAVEAGQAAGVAQESLIGQLVRLVAVISRRWQALAASCGTLNFDASVGLGKRAKRLLPGIQQLASGQWIDKAPNQNTG